MVEKGRDRFASVQSVVVYQRRNLGRDRVEVGSGKDRLDMLVNPVVWRQIGHVGKSVWPLDLWASCRCRQVL